MSISAWAPTWISAGAGVFESMVVSVRCGMAGCSPGVCEQAHMLSDRNNVICGIAIKRIGVELLLLMDNANIAQSVFTVKV